MKTERVCQCDLEVGHVCEACNPWWRVEVIDSGGQVVAIERDMLVGREIGDDERRSVMTAIRNLQGFIGDKRELRLLELHRRFHGKAGCPGGDACYVCEAENDPHLHERPLDLTP